jgi:hypothetical protein
MTTESIPYGVKQTRCYESRLRRDVEKTRKDSAMIREKMGEKRRCLSCNTAFFDLNRTKIVCPKCAAVFQVIEPVRSSARSAGAFNTRSKWPTPPLDMSSLAVVSDIAVESASKNAEPAELDAAVSVADDVETDA